MITKINQTEILDIIRMREKGLSAENVAKRKQVSASALRRYVRIFYRYGLDAFREI